MHLQSSRSWMQVLLHAYKLIHNSLIASCNPVKIKSIISHAYAWQLEHIHVLCACAYIYMKVNVICPLISHVYIQQSMQLPSPWVFFMDLSIATELIIDYRVFTVIDHRLYKWKMQRQKLHQRCTQRSAVMNAEPCTEQCIQQGNSTKEMLEVYALNFFLHFFFLQNHWSVSHKIPFFHHKSVIISFSSLYKF